MITPFFSFSFCFYVTGEYEYHEDFVESDPKKNRDKRRNNKRSNHQISSGKKI